MSRNSFDATNCAGKRQDELLATTQAYYTLARQSSGSLKPYNITSIGYQVLQWHPPAGTPVYNLAKTVMTLKSTTPLRKTISGKFDKRYESLRYTAPRPIPTNDNLYLTTKAIESLNQLVRMIGSSALDDKILTDPNVI